MIAHVASKPHPRGSLKAKYMKQMCVVLDEKYSRAVPDTFEGLVSLPGVG